MKTKIYAHLRIEDLELHQKVKERAVKERKTAIQFVEQALKDALKKPLIRA